MRSLLALLIILIFVSEAQAGGLLGARSSSLGAAGRAAGESIDALFLNPAGIGLSKKLNFGSGYSSGRLTADAFRETYSATSSDGTAGTYTPGALGYKYHRVRIGDEVVIEQEFVGGFAVALGERFRLGASYSQIRSDGEDLKLIQHNIGMGMHFVATKNWNIALSAQGLIPPQENLPEALVRPSRWGLSSTYNVMDIFRLRYDVLAPVFDTAQAGPLAHHAGMSLILRGFFQLNGGYIVDDIQGQNWLTTGLVWEGPRLKVGYSYQSESRQGLGDRHLVDLWLDI